MDMQKEREEFEAWFGNTICDLWCADNREVQMAWEAWQAAKAESHKSASLYQWEINHLAAANQQLRGYAAKASAVPDGFILVDKSKINTFWQDDDEPENFCDRESDFDCLGDYIDLGDIMTIKKHDQALVSTETLYGTWFADAIDPSAKANFFVGTHAECLAIVKKNKAMIEAAQEQGQ